MPVDWVAKALIRLALKRGLKRDVYHLSSGSGGASTFGEIRDALAVGHPGERIAYQQVEGATLARQVLARKDLFHDVNRKLLARALCLYGRFAESGTMFDNRHTLDEGVPEPLPFAMYAGRCAATAEATSIAAQMEDDFK